jgi:hypothetical protein
MGVISGCSTAFGGSEGDGGGKDRSAIHRPQLRLILINFLKALNSSEDAHPNHEHLPDRWASSRATSMERVGSLSPMFGEGLC